MRRWPERQRRTPWLPWLLVGGTGTVLTLAAANGWRSLLERSYERARPWVESRVGQVLGHPLEMGPLQGIGPDGLRIGPSRLLPGSRDSSSVQLQGATVSLDPFESWRRRQLILDLTFHGAEADLRRNADGQLWVLGPLPPGGEPPALELRLRLLEPATLRFWGLAADRTRPITLTAAGQVDLGLRRRALDLRARAAAPGLPGMALLVKVAPWCERHNSAAMAGK